LRKAGVWDVRNSAGQYEATGKIVVVNLKKQSTNSVVMMQEMNRRG
jgi:hypothetical protein